MKKKLVALMLTVVMCIAATVIPAAAANYDGVDYSAIKGDCVYVNSYDNLTVFLQGEDGDEGLVGQANVGSVNGVVLFCTPESTGNIVLALNAENSGWNSDVSSEPVAYDGGVYYANVAATSPFVDGEGYSQYCICNWSGANVTILGLAVVGADGNYIKTIGTCPETSPLVAAAAPAPALPQTGVVSSLALVALGSTMIGSGVVLTRKNRKED